MEARPESPVEEITRVRASDLNRILGLAALWAPNEPQRIVGALLNELVGTFRLAFAFVRVNDPNGGFSIEMSRVAEPGKESRWAQGIDEALKGMLGEAPFQSSGSAQMSIGDVNFSITSTALGIHGELGIVVAGSEKAGFASQPEELVLAVVANQASLALQQAYTRIAEQSSKIETAKDAFGQNQRGPWPGIDSIPGCIALLTKAGEVSVVNRQLMDYFGATIEEIGRW